MLLARYHHAITMPTLKQDLMRTTVSLTPEQHEWLRQKAFQERRPIAMLIRDMLEDVRRRDQPQEELPFR